MPENDSRAERRSHEQRIKDRAKRIMRLWFGPRAATAITPRAVGVNASTHCRPCACWMCQAKASNVPRRRERAFLYPDPA